MVINAHYRFIEFNCYRIKLTNLEARLLLLLSDNKFHDYGEICNYLYNYDSDSSRNTLRVLQHRLRKKLSLDIKICEHRGLILKNKLFIDR